MQKRKILHHLLQYGRLEYDWLYKECSLTGDGARDVIEELRELKIDIIDTPCGYTIKEGHKISPNIIRAVATLVERERQGNLDRGGISACDIPLFVKESTESTNLDAKRFAEEHPECPCALFIADRQTAGRGRLGRSFLSRGGVGLYFSLLLRDVGNAIDALSLTTYSAVALCRALRRVADVEPKIKWVNDIYIGERKLAGILTEGRLSAEGGGGLDYAVIGIGVNIARQDFGELLYIATDIESECGTKPDRSSLAGELLGELLLNLSEVGSQKIEEEYNSLSMLGGRRVRVIEQRGEYLATVLGIAEGCALRVRLDTGEEKFLNSGEVSLKIDD